MSVELPEPSTAKLSGDLPDGDESAYEGLRGYEEQLMGLLDLFNRTDQEIATDTHFDIEQYNTNQELSEIDDSVPDLMSEGLTCWTDFLMDDFANDKLLPVPDCDSFIPCDFLSIGIAPLESASILPSLPESLFNGTSADSNTSDTITREGGLHDPEDPSHQLHQPNVDMDIFPPRHSSSNILTTHTEPQAAQQAEPAMQLPLPADPPTANTGAPTRSDSIASSHTQTGVEQQECSTKPKAQKRKRASKPKDPNAPKRRPGRPRVALGFNCLKHIKAFEQAGGFTNSPMTDPELQGTLTGAQQDAEK